MEQQEITSAVSDSDAAAAAAAAAAPAAVADSTSALKAAAAAQLGLSDADYDALMAPNDRWPFRATDDGARARNHPQKRGGGAHMGVRESGSNALGASADAVSRAVRRCLPSASAVQGARRAARGPARL
jgi:hypothetical protein